MIEEDEMKLELRRHAWLAISALLLAALLLTGVGGPAAATPPKPVLPDQNGGVITSDRDGVDVAAARPWTEAEMAAAKPYPLPEVEAKALTEAIESIEKELAAGPAGAIPGALPGGEPAPSGNGTQLLNIGPSAGLTGYGYPPPYTRFQVFTGIAAPNTYTLWPYVTVGKLFFTQRGSNYVCSAASIRRYAIWTAGHCVHDGSNSSAGWSTNVVFVPAYLNNARPRQTWSAKTLATSTYWYSRGNPNGLRYDFGAVGLKKNGSYGIGDIVGYLGFAWNWAYQQHWNSFGYPAASPFNGQTMHTCQASYAYSLSYGNIGALTQAIGCDMTGGCSGGPWILQFGTGNYLNSDNSYGRTGYSQELNGPHFTDGYASAKTLFDWCAAFVP